MPSASVSASSGHRSNGRAFARRSSYSGRPSGTTASTVSFMITMCFTPGILSRMPASIG